MFYLFPKHQMKIEGTTALITGAGSGIGRAIALELSKKGAYVTVVEFNLNNGNETVELIKKEKEGSTNNLPPAIFVKCDVSKPDELYNAFETHMHVYGRMDICINNAGIGELEWFVQDDSKDGKGKWRNVIDVNLMAMIDGTRIAIRAMQKLSKGGVIINVASAAGLYPSPSGPVYSASKGGVVLFSRSLAHLKKSGIRVNALCPEFIDTAIVNQMSNVASNNFSSVINSLGGFIPMSVIVEGFIELIEDESKCGDCLWITNRFGKRYWPDENEKKLYTVLKIDKNEKKSNEKSSRNENDLHKKFRKIVVKQLSTNFREATEIIYSEISFPIPENKILVKYYYAGINASDINYSAGKYFGEKEAKAKLPFDAGFEAVGIIVEIGKKISRKVFCVNSPVATLTYGGFSEYSLVDDKFIIPINEVSPQMISLMTSGLTASIALEQSGRMSYGESVLVTAAAGGTGQFAVQLAKLAGNTVIATCGGEEKEKMLKSLGVDRVINYQKENVKRVLRKEFPRGVDLIFESVGGDMFETCLNSLSRFGRLIIIGMISQYTAGDNNEWITSKFPGICEKLLWKSQTLVGFFLIHYASLWRKHFSKLYSLYKSGHLKVNMDPKEFVGLESVADAVEYLHSGKSLGKVIVRISNDAPLLNQSRL